MHPPPFRLNHRLSDWPDCSLELRCCKGVVLYPVKLLIRRSGDRTFDAVLDRLRCNRCGGKPTRSVSAPGIASTSEARRQIGRSSWYRIGREIKGNAEAT